MCQSKESIKKSLKKLVVNKKQKTAKIQVLSFIEFVKYLNGSENWKKAKDEVKTWVNSTGVIKIKNSTKGFILHRV